MCFSSFAPFYFTSIILHYYLQQGRSVLSCVLYSLWTWWRAGSWTSKEPNPTDFGADLVYFLCILSSSEAWSVLFGSGLGGCPLLGTFIFNPPFTDEAASLQMNQIFKDEYICAPMSPSTSLYKLFWYFSFYSTVTSDKRHPAFLGGGTARAFLAQMATPLTFPNRPSRGRRNSPVFE